MFFMPAPPEDIRPPRDFRHLPGPIAGALSPQLRLAIRRAELRQDLAAELLADEDRSIRKLIGSVKLPADASQVAQALRRAAGVEIETQMSWPTSNDALNSWINAFENLGVLVFQIMGISVEEMRGLSIHHEVVPAILLNTADAVRARVFSLAHELGHIVLGAEGLCDLADPDAASDRIEVFCNAFAGEFLVPSSDLLAHDHDPEEECRRLFLER